MKPVTDRITRSGNLWSTVDWQPNHEDYRAIADLAVPRGESSVRIGIAHREAKVRIFEVTRRANQPNDLEFIETGEFCLPEVDDAIFSEWQRELIVAASRFETFSTEQLAAFQFPYDYHRGSIRRAPANYYSERGDWTDDEMHPEYDEWEEIDTHYRAKDLTQTQFQRLRKLGVMQSAGYNAWELCKLPSLKVPTKGKKES